MPSALPLAAGEWTFDPNHSGVYFKVRHLGLTNVRGRFNGVDAWLVVGDDLASTRFGATIDIATIDTNQPDRDAHLLSTDFFAADSHPTLTFTSTTIHDVGGGEYAADGELTINGITNSITLAVEFTGAEVHPGDGMLHSGFIASTQDAPRRLRDRLQHAAGRRQVRPRQEDRCRDRRAVHSTASLIAAAWFAAVPAWEPMTHDESFG